MMPVVAIQELTTTHEPAYERFVSHTPSAGPYHTLPWRNLLRDTYGFVPKYIVAIDKRDVVGILPLFLVSPIFGARRLVCLPFSHHVPAIASNDEILTQLLDRAVDLCESLNCSYLEIKHGLPLPADARFISKEIFYSTKLDLRHDIEEIWSGLSASARRAIRKAEQSTLSISSSTNLEEIDAFHEIAVETRKRQGVPPYPRSFFLNLRSLFKSFGGVKLYLALTNNRTPVAGLIMIYYDDEALYAYGGSLGNGESLRLRPNNLLFWSAICDAKRTGCSVFDFGTTHPHNKGLLRFKGGWGASHSMLPYHYYLTQAKDLPPVFSRTRCSYELASSILKYMPKPIYYAIGSRLLHRLG